MFGNVILWTTLTEKIPPRGGGSLLERETLENEVIFQSWIFS